MAKTYVVEHLDPELGPWSALEYVTIAQESDAAGAKFCLSSVSKDLNLPPELLSASSLRVEQRDADSIFQNEKETVCLLDPAAKKELGPDDNVKFDVFLFGGILGDDPPRGKSERDPLRALLTWIDRTSQLRKQGFEGRRLGPVQMTTDTAVRVTRKVIQDGVSLNDIPYVDFPELKLDEHESTEMPFRYIKDASGNPIMPEGMIELIKKDADKSLDDLL